jgi:acetyltransferase-like isoleucine patch superfamily enzyme
MKSLIKRFVGHTAPYKIAALMIARYQEERAAVRRPEEFKELGQGVVIEPGVRITMPGRVVLKNRASICRGTLINSSGGLYVGENSGIRYTNRSIKY